MTLLIDIHVQLCIHIHILTIHVVLAMAMS